MIIDMHIHTIYSGDSIIAPEDLIEQAEQLGLDGICVTEHDSYQASQVAAEFAEGTDLLVLRGIEISTDLGHILVYGIMDDDWKTLGEPKRIAAQELIDYARSRGAVAIPAHPFGGARHSIGDDLSSLAGIFAIEGYNGEIEVEDNLRACDLAEELNLKIIGGSDAHRLGEIGRCVTVFERHIETLEQLLDELGAGRFQAKYL